MQTLSMVAGAVTMASSWSFRNFLSNSATTLRDWANLGFIVIGIVCLIVGIVMLVKGLMTHGRGQTNWVVVVALILIGGALTVSGAYTWVQNIAQGGKETIDDLGGTGMIGLFGMRDIGDGLKSVGQMLKPW